MCIAEDLFGQINFNFTENITFCNELLKCRELLDFSRVIRYVLFVLTPALASPFPTPPAVSRRVDRADE